MPTLLVLLAMSGTAPSTCTDVHAPFDNLTRKSFKVLNKRISSEFGAYRGSFVKGHKHAGVDIRTDYGESILAMCAGRVADIHLGFPHRTVVVEHRNADGSLWYSSYKHITDIQVKVGEDVTVSTRIGRVFNRDEQSRTGWRLNHLHLEIRKSIDDGGDASWTSMTMLELKRWAYDPQAFLRRRMAAKQPSTR